MFRKILTLFFAAVVLTAAKPAFAQESAELRQRGEQVMAMLRGEGAVSDMFNAAFLAQVSETQLRGISQQLTAQYGAPRALRIEANAAHRGILHVETERGLISLTIVLDPAPPHRISGLVVSDARLTGGTIDGVLGEIRDLPGQTAVAVARLGGTDPVLIAAHEPGRALAIGSSFKLFILAEISRQVQAGERRWDEVVRLDSRSLPSGMLQNWPQGSPLTVHSLASLMISISDNTATDALLKLAGRENVERMMARVGVAAPGRNRPFLSTAEVFALKTATEADQRAFIGANEAERRRLLESRYSTIDPDRIDPSIFAGAPLQIENLEWFASPTDLVRTMDWLRREGDETARQILAISPGVPAALKAEVDYIGYKGGSEPGVINLTWLIRNKEGIWHVVTGAWNNPSAPVEEARFAGLMNRLIQFVR